MSFLQNCQHINETFVVKCVDKSFTYVMKDQPFWHMSFNDWLMVAIGLLSAFGTIFAVIVALWANKLAKEEAKSNKKILMESVRPYLHVEVGVSNSGSEYYLHLKNSGMGPALIKRFSIDVNGVEVDIDTVNPQKVILNELYSVFGADKGKWRLSRELYLSNPGLLIPAKGSALGVNEVFDVLSIDAVKGFTIQQYEIIDSLIKVSVEYEDLYRNSFDLTP